jgi:MoaA/NifB/PqqE/SkfB family radical SAM enzyme
VHERAFQLRLADGVVYAEREGKHLFLQPATPDWMVVSQNGAILLSRCVGATLEEILGDAGESLWEQALDLFSEALGRGLLVNSAKAQQRLERTKLSSCGTQQALATVHLKLTNQCNLGCSYCYAESGTRTSVLEWEDLSLISRHVAAISKTVSYVLSGGEPLLHSRALDFAEKVRSDGNQVHLLTNGTLIDESNATRIAAAADLVKISLDGSTDRIHATTRGRGNFAKVTRAIELLIRCGANVVVAMTVTQRNRSDIAAMVSRYGSRLALQPLFNAGRGIAANDLALTGREYYKARGPTLRNGRARNEHRGKRRCISLPTVA